MDWRSRWIGGQRIAASRGSPAVMGALLGVLAVAEAIARAAVIGVSAQLGVVLGVLALATTLPLALLPPAGAAVAVTAACVISLAFFHTITVAGVAAELIALHRLGRTGASGRSTAACGRGAGDAVRGARAGGPASRSRRRPPS